jgi:glycosyltransferase involved in cell wall biosynthesis
VPEKRIDALVEAMPLVRERRPDARLAILGDGRERPRLERLAAAHAPDGAVVFTGTVAEEEVEAWLARAACLATASEREGYGLVVVEAAAHGTPSVVVAGPENAATELVEEGRNGAVAASIAPAELAGAILRVLDAGDGLRETTTQWFAERSAALGIERSLEVVEAAYAGAAR